MQGEYVYYEGVKYSLSCLGTSMVLSGSMVTGLFTLQVLLISGAKGISSESSDRRPSIQQQSKQIFFVILIYHQTLVEGDLKKNVLRESSHYGLFIGKSLIRVYLQSS